MDAKHTPLTLAEAFRLIARFLKPEAGFVWTAVVYGLAVALLGLATPVSVQLLINSVANLAGFGAPAVMGYLREHTGSVSTGLWLVAAVEAAALVLILAFVPPATREMEGAGETRLTCPHCGHVEVESYVIPRQRSEGPRGGGGRSGGEGSTGPW